MTQIADWTTTEMGKLLEADSSLNTIPNITDIITSTVISASKKEVLLDFNGIMTGIVRGKELYNEYRTLG